MALIERFSGRPDPETPFGEMVANPAIKRPLSYQMLFMNALDLDAEALALAIRAYHPTLDKARVELVEVLLENVPEEEAGSIIGLAGWANHVVKLVGFNAKIPDAAFETCVRPAHFSMQLKEEAKQHKSHLLLYYAGYEADPLEQYVALTVVAAALSRFGAILLLNEAGRSAFPAEALLVDDPDHDSLEMLRAMPIPLLYGGFVKIEIDGEPGVWMRTFGNSLLNLPDLAFKAEGHHQGSETFDMFANMLDYLRQSGSTIAPGHTMQIGDDVHFRMRTRSAEEWFLESDGDMLVAEKMAEAGGNRVELPA